MRDNSYYSIRTGKNPDGIRFDLAKLKKLFLSEYELFENKSYFQEAFGYTCVDSGNVPGTLGSNIVLQRKVGTDVLNLNILGMLSCLERDQTYQERTHAHADWSRNLSRAGLHPGAP